MFKWNWHGTKRPKRAQTVDVILYFGSDGTRAAGCRLQLCMSRYCGGSLTKHTRVCEVPTRPSEI